MKSKIKSILLMIIIFSISILSCSCQNSKKNILDANNPLVITIWHYYNGGQKNTFDELVKEFNETEGKEKGIIVEAVGQGSITDLDENLMNSANKKVGASEMPNIFAIYADTAKELDNLNVLANLDNYLNQEEVEEYLESYIEVGRFNAKDELKILPTAKSVEVMMINKTDWDIFQSETGAKIEEFQTWEGVCKLAKQYYEWTDSLTEKENDGKAFFGRDSFANYMIIGAKQLGHEILKVDNGIVNLNVDKSVMKKLWENYYIPYINGWFAEYGRFRSDDAKTGDIIALVGSSSGASYFPTEVFKSDDTTYSIDSMVLPIPNFEGFEPYGVQQGAGMAVAQSTKEEEYASVEFLKWFTDSERNTEFSIGSGYLPVKKEANNFDFIENIIDKLDMSSSENIIKTLKVAIDETANYTLYEGKTFDGSNDARFILNTSMIEKAKQDRETICNLIENGMKREQAIAIYENEDNFEEWYKELKISLEEICKTN